MKKRQNRVFTLGCVIYLLCVFASYVFGLITRDEAGVSFLPTVVLTLPWFYLLGLIAEKFNLMAAMSAWYGLPTFGISAVLNVLVVAAFRLWRERSQILVVNIAPR